MGRDFLKVLLGLVLLFVNAEDADDAYNDDGGSGALEICKKSVVVVDSLEVLCDSPYTYYYGNGAHRNSIYCDYGDKVTISFSLDVTEDLEDTAIYMLMSAYTPNDMELYLGEPVDVCSAYLGEECNYEGIYNFTTKVQFAYLDDGEAQFVPTIEFSFSDQPDSGYNLGGANIECDYGNGFIDWASDRTNTTLLHIKTQTFMSSYGILIGTILVLAMFVALLVKQSGDRIEYQGPADSKSVELIRHQG
mmetsp:Transcript_4328/g.7487  ORF Transcript_4328/g.7487 Transcript_4328/m.7487 type:complete len:248 (-) Transcript_4328:214-957(-)